MIFKKIMLATIAIVFVLAMAGFNVREHENIEGKVENSQKKEIGKMKRVYNTVKKQRIEIKQRIETLEDKVEKRTNAGKIK